MNDKEIKQLRGQLRQIVKETLPTLLASDQYDLLRKHVDDRLSEVEKFVKESMRQLALKHGEGLKELQKAQAEVLSKIAKE